MRRQGIQTIRSQPESLADDLDPRWTALAFALLVASLLLYATLTVPLYNLPAPAILVPLVILLIAAPLTGGATAARSRLQRLAAVLLLVFDVALVLLLIGRTGSLLSPFWLALMVPLIAALLLLPGAPGVSIAIAIWLSYGAIGLSGPPDNPTTAVAVWLLRGMVLAVVGLLLERTVNAHRRLSRRAHERERVLHDFLALSNRLRATSQVHTLLEEVAVAVQSAGNFIFVTISRVNWDAGQVQVAVAFGASGRRLSAIEQLAFPWQVFAELLDAGEAAGAQGRLVERLPYRSLPRECHLILPLGSQLAETVGLLTVTVEQHRSNDLREALPLIELLANQAAAALDNHALYNTLEQRVEQATADLERSAAQLGRARDRAEALYRITRTLSETLDEQQVLEQTLALVGAATGAGRGGIMLIDTASNRLVFRANLDATSHDASLARDEGLAGWVLEHRKAALIADTHQDRRWVMRSDYDRQARSVLAVPLLLEHEALGILVLLHHTTGYFNADHQQLALAAAGQAAVALSKAQLYRYVSEQSASLGHIARQREEEASKILAMLRSIGDGVVVSDQSGLVRIVNPVAEHMLGIPAHSLIDRPLLDLPGACEPKGERQIEKVGVNDLMLRAHSAPVRSSRGERLGTVVVYHDLTREEQLDRLKSRLVATASHELRTPMTSIMGFVDMLRIGTYGPLSEIQQEPLMIIRSNVQRLVELVDDLLDMSRADAGELRLRKEQLDLADLLREVAEDLRGQFETRGVTISLDLPQAAVSIYADRAAMTQVTINLLGNACKYTPGGGHVDVRLRNGKGRLRVDVRDNGVGITPDAQPHIFTPFYRADNPLRDEVGGTGLGLSISQRLIELHGGRIWFESATGVGSTFSFSLPLSEPARSSQPPAHRHPR